MSCYQFNSGHDDHARILRSPAFSFRQLFFFFFFPLFFSISSSPSFGFKKIRNLPFSCRVARLRIFIHLRKICTCKNIQNYAKMFTYIHRQFIAIFFSSLVVAILRILQIFFRGLVSDHSTFENVSQFVIPRPLFFGRFNFNLQVDPLSPT